MNRTIRPLRLFSLLTTGVMFLVVLMGAWVTNTESGDGCGAHWPLCHGTFMPDWDYEAIVEFSHRAVAGLAGLMTVILLLWIWRALPGWRKTFWMAAGALLLVVVQGALGAMAVLWPQPKAVLALHFGISVMCFALVLLVSVLLYRGEEGPTVPAPPPLVRAIWGMALYTYLVVYLGAYVRHVDAAMACTGWPLCNGQLLPTLYGPVGANMAHRLGAALAMLLMLRLWWLARRAAERPDLQRGAALGLWLMVAQVLSGALFPLGYYNLLTQMLHTGLISAFWGVLSYLCFQVLPERRGEPATAARAGVG
ncbi:MAG: COX15/CtaA family protein [Bacillota bacterium]